jgi:hypothetical protein
VSTAQNMVALARANAVRGKQAELKRRVYAGEISLADVLDPTVETEYDEAAESVPLEALLRSPRRMGSARTWKLLWELRIYRQGMKLADVGPLSRVQLATILRERGIGEPNG